MTIIREKEKRISSSKHEKLMFRNMKNDRKKKKTNDTEKKQPVKQKKVSVIAGWNMRKFSYDIFLVEYEAKHQMKKRWGECAGGMRIEKMV